MSKPIRLLLAEDNPDDVELVLLALRTGGLDLEWECVETEADYLAALERQPDIIISDHAMPAFSAPRALELLQHSGKDIPFIVASGTIGEDTAVAIMKSGADDYLLKDHLARLAPAVERSIANAAMRRKRRAAEQALRESEARYRLMVETAEEGVWLFDAEDRISLANAKMTRMLGYEDGEMLGGRIEDFVHPSEVSDARGVVERCRKDGGGRHDFRLRRKDGEWVWSILSMSPMRYDDEHKGTLAMVTDITERKRSELALRDSENRLRTLIDAEPECVKLIDSQGILHHINAAGLAMMECDYPEEVLGKSIYSRILPEYRDAYIKFIERVMKGERDRMAYELIGLKGTRRWMDSHAVPFRMENEDTSFVLSITRDVSEQKRSEERIEYLAYFDTLTGLPNRLLLHDRLQQALFEAERQDHRVAILFVDLDRFKNVNDSLGHAAGDLLLKAVAERLSALVRQGDTVARLGGDEITIVLTAVTDEEEIGRATGKILHAFESPFDIEGRELFVTASLGVAVYPSDGKDVTELLRNADAAMYRAKELGRNTVQLYSREFTRQVTRSLALENALRQALEREEFTLHYQPVVCLKTGRIVATEALIRWNHPEFGMVPPAQFIPIAEETGLIVQIGTWVLHRACRQAQEWISAGLPPCRMSVNLSARQARAAELMTTVRSALDGCGLEARYLSLELTETDLMQTQGVVVQNLHQLAAMGIEILVDDFGTGYSSLSYLRRFPVHTLKIDRSFVSGITDNPSDATITRAIISMAHSLNLTVVAEGVETQDQLRFVRQHLCETVQGYFFSRPLPPDELGRILDRPYILDHSE